MVLPAYAGMIPVKLAYALHSPRAPRVCGDDPYTMLDNLKLG